MNQRIFNFSSGPAVMPLPVLERAREEMLAIDGAGMSVMEMSHRSARFGEILENSEAGLRSLLAVPANYQILFIQGGASLQFSMVPMNLLAKGSSADYLITGAWGEKAIREAKLFGQVKEIYSSAAVRFSRVPQQDEVSLSADAAYVHYTSNETIDGVEFPYDLDGGGIPVVCDASSNILSKPIDINKFALIYAGAQKNIGPSGVAVVIIRDDLLERIPDGLATMFDYRSFAGNDSMPNTPNTWAIYLIGLVCDWLMEQGGLAGIAETNRRKAKVLYDAIDSSDGFYQGCADRNARSLMNVTFRLQNEDLENEFVSQSEAAGLDGLRGHRSVGGIRASIYNAFPEEGVHRLIDFMDGFAGKNV